MMSKSLDDTCYPFSVLTSAHGFCLMKPATLIFALGITALFLPLAPWQAWASEQSRGPVAQRTSAARASAPANPFLGRWVNQRGSTVCFAANSETLSGYYHTHLGQPDKNEGFPVTGFVSGDVIAFAVSFKGYGSITSWVGQLSEDQDGDFIQTLWQLTRDVEDSREAQDLWRSISTGASVFRRATLGDDPGPADC